MVRHFGFDVDAVEDNTGLNALAVAVKSGDLHMTEYLVLNWVRPRPIL